MRHPHHDVIVWVDHHEARILRVREADHLLETTVPSAPRHVRRHAAQPAHDDAKDARAHHHAIARALEGVESVSEVADAELAAYARTQFGGGGSPAPRAADAPRWKEEGDER